MNLTQLLVTQDNVDMLTQQFGLTEEQTLEAMGALIPAFSHGLKRNATSPQGAIGLIEALATGRHAHYAEAPGNAASTFGVQEGNAILGHLFGNKDVSRALADQASQSSGVGSSILKSMLPVIASMLMGSLFKGATAGRNARGGGLESVLGNALSGRRSRGGGGILGQIIEGLAGGSLDGASNGRGQSGGGLEDLLGGILGGQQSSPARTRRRSRTRQGQPTQRRRRTQSGGLGADGLGDIFDELLGGGQRTRTRRTSPSSRNRTTRRTSRRTRRSGGGLGDIFGDMLEAGGNTSEDIQRKTGSVFDELLGPN